MKNYTQLSHEFIKWKHKVNNVNRYFTNTPLLDLLWDNKGLFEYHIPQNEHFYRGRIFNIDDVAPTNSKYENWVDDRNNVFEGYGKKDSGAPTRRNAAEGRLNGKGISFLYTCNSRTTVIYELRPTRDEKISIAEFVTERDVVFADLTKRIEIFGIYNWQISKTIVYQFSIASLESFSTFHIMIQ